MEYIVEKIGMSRTIGVPSIPVTLLKVVNAKVCEINEDGSALVAYSYGKKFNKPIEGQQKKYNLSKEFNRFATVSIDNATVGEYNLEFLNQAKKVKVTLKTTS